MTVGEAGTLLQISRFFAAPRDKVFAAWTRPDILKQWWGPKGGATRVVEIDLREGGAYRFGMQFPGQDVFYVSGIYQEVSPPERVVFTWRWEQPEMDFGESLVTIEFRERAAGTEVTLRHEGFPNEEICSEHDTGWNDFFDKYTDLILKG